MSVLYANHTAAGFSAAGLRNGRARTSAGSSKLNLVSLMDIFTILVFFLMVNTGDVEILQPDEKIVLPQSFTEVKPKSAPVVKLSSSGIFFKEELIGASDALQGSKTDPELVDSLYQALVAEKAAMPVDTVSSLNGEGGKGLPISVMGDVTVPYALLKRVLYTCAQAGFRDVGLAVEHADSRGEAAS